MKTIGLSTALNLKELKSVDQYMGEFVSVWAIHKDNPEYGFFNRFSRPKLEIRSLRSDEMVNHSGLRDDFPVLYVVILV